MFTLSFQVNKNYTFSVETMTDSMPEDETTPLFNRAAIPSQLFGANRLAWIYIITGIVGLIGNTVVVIVLLSSASFRRKIPNLYIIHQSMVDALVSLALIGTTRITPLSNYEGETGYLNCIFWQNKMILWILLLCSTYNLTVLTTERYTEIVFPIYHKLRFTRNKAIISLVGVWLFSIAFELVGKAPTSYISDGRCYFVADWPNKAARQAYGIWVVIVKYFLPLVIIIYCYGHIAYVLHKKVASTAQGNTDGRLQRGKRNTIKTLAIVAAAFVLCWSCNQFYFLLYNAGYRLSLKSDVYHISVILDFVNSCVNPVIYVFNFEQFQTTAKLLFYKIVGRNQIAPAQTAAAASAGTSGS